MLTLITLTLVALDPAVPTAAPRPGPRPQASVPRPPGGDATVRRTQATPADLPALPTPAPTPVAVPEAMYVGNSISLQAALLGAVTSNPDLVTLRNSNIASPEAVEVARRFPVTLNPTLWVDFRPITLIPPDTFGGAMPHHTGPYYHMGKVFYYLSYRQPVELGHQTTHRYHIAQAALNQQHWNILQGELTTVVQAYRFFQTAAYRREKLRLAKDLADFNDRLLQALRRGLEANQAAPADVALAEVENQATRQQVEVAMQDYANALTDLRNQMGVPETAGNAEPLGEFILPANIPEIEDQQLIQIALQNRPDLFAARAAVDGAAAAVRLAKGDRIPTPIVGPLFQGDEVSVLYVGLVYITPLPFLNNGKPLVIQREAEYCRMQGALQAAEQRAATQVKAAAAKWNAANRLIARTGGLTGGLKTQMAGLERLFDQNQATLAQLLQARQRLIQLENAELDALWQATQAQADLLLALGAPYLIAALHQTEIKALTAAGNPPNPPAVRPAAPNPPQPPPQPQPQPQPAAGAAR
jgi:cobalt-zinc-cadmium efflux system outer membrane protein